MEGFMAFPSFNAAFAALLFFAVTNVNGQVGTPCSPSMITTFTPCLNFITGSSANGASSTAACCDSLKSLMSTSMDCTCFIITGGVPFSLPTSTQLAISLPRVCKSSLPIQCKASGFVLPAPGPALFAPSPPPVAASPSSPRASKAAALPPTLAPAPAETALITPVASPSTEPLAPTATATATTAQRAPSATGIRPVLTPASASNPSSVPLSLLISVLAVVLSKFH